MYSTLRPFHFHVTTLGKLFTHTHTCHQAKTLHLECTDSFFIVFLKSPTLAAVIATGHTSVFTVLRVKKWLNVIRDSKLLEISALLQCVYILL